MRAEDYSFVGDDGNCKHAGKVRDCDQATVYSGGTATSLETVRGEPEELFTAGTRIHAQPLVPNGNG